MNIKLIALDLDGTLLRSDNTISRFTLDILERCRQNGILIGIATARSEMQAKKYTDKFCPDIIISNGGALATYKDEVIYKSVLPASVSDKLFKYLFENQSVKRITSLTEASYYRNFCDTDAGHFDFLGGEYNDFSKPLFQNVYKITAEILDKEIAVSIAEKFDCKLTCFREENWYKFSTAAANKLAAVTAICDHFGITISEVAAFGDDSNDLELIKECGYGVAMGNAIDEVKAVAKYIADTNDNDGIAKWLEENVLRSCKA